MVSCGPAAGLSPERGQQVATPADTEADHTRLTFNKLCRSAGQVAEVAGVLQLCQAVQDMQTAADVGTENEEAK